MQITIVPARKLRGEIKIPGDKSISHRGIIFGAISKGKTVLNNFLMGKDCLKTIEAFKQMGIEIEIKKPATVIVYGKGLHGLEPPADIIDAGNSGTTARLLTGLLSGQNFESKITGDESLKRRPMKRVVDPLRKMGAIIEGSDGGNFLPLSIKGGRLKGINYHLPVASAQVKSALILATLYADNPSRITEPVPSRNHTEIMLSAFGGRLDMKGNTIIAYPDQNLTGQVITVPGDISSAAYFITAALLVPDSVVTIKNVGINPTRSGIIDVYRKMGADITVENIFTSGGEKIGDITVRTTPLKATEIGGEEIPRLIDEIPVIALAATQACGTTVIRDAQELKVKESNRIASIVNTLSKLGASIEATYDGMVIHGPTPLRGNAVETYSDHRIAMMAAVAGLIAEGETRINGWEWVNISFPGFLNLLNRLIHS